MHDIKLTAEIHAPASLAILVAMLIRRYGSKHIAQYAKSQATLEATGCRHRASICHVLPRWMPWSSIRHKKLSCGVVEIAF